ncbi:pantoate--beta-alanine ligase [Clostridium sp. C8-1-8]|uniref:pantoate--beta-alanine ligase n=1 Tax=Clostridium sp. C8-1-8 TaxID=2698831 RepID=UPI00136EFE3B|nr:pantoate--beta-alanine ligase [Clostridium sp. C8-1-8]
MRVVNTIKEVRDIIGHWKREGLSVGLVPTMGYLHEGHGSLIETAHKENDKVVVSVFVNPIQFGPTEDLDKYPRDLERDSKIVEDFGGDLIFTPTPSEMYVEDFASFVEVSNLTEGLCGAKRPGHFRGVCTVVTKLFNIVTPDKAYFGEKDAQQLAVIKKMVRDLNVPIEIVGCPIVREADGLAKSSRNVYLSSEERTAALILSKSLAKAKEALNNGERASKSLSQLIIDTLSSEPLAKIDYVEIVDILSLMPVENIEKDILIALAVYIGKTRLIDNFTYRLS